MRNIHTIVLHCSASDRKDQNADDIRKYHVFNKGWSDIGYHYVIRKDGVIEDGRPMEKIGAHVSGKNTGTVGVCLVGLNSFTKAQMKSVHLVIAQITRDVGKGPLKIKGHHHFTNMKTCPNFKVDDFLNGKLTIIKKY